MIFSKLKIKFILFTALFLTMGFDGESLALSDPGSFLGVCSQITRETRQYNPFAIHEELLDSIQSANIHFTRTGFKWKVIHPSKNKWDWRVADEIVASATAKNIQILALVSGMPVKTMGNPATYIELWKEFVDSLSIRYAQDVKHWEIWNEPNIRSGKYWPQDALPEVFAEYVIEAAQVIRKNQLDATILLGGLTTGKKAKPFKHWEDLFDLGVLEVVDGIAYHPYHYSGKSLIEFNNKLYALVGKHTSKQMEYWVTEYGFPGVDKESSKFSFKAQERNLLKSALIHWAHGGTKFFIYSLKDKKHFDPSSNDQTIRKNRGGYFGLIKLDGSPKPSLDAVRWLARLTQNYIPVKLEQKQGGVLITARHVQTGKEAFFSWGSGVHRGLLDQSQKKRISSYETKHSRIDLSVTNQAAVEAHADDVLFWR